MVPTTAGPSAKRKVTRTSLLAVINLMLSKHHMNQEAKHDYDIGPNMTTRGAPRGQAEWWLTLLTVYRTDDPAEVMNPMTAALLLAQKKVCKEIQPVVIKRCRSNAWIKNQNTTTIVKMLVRSNKNAGRGQQSNKRTTNSKQIFWRLDRRKEWRQVVIDKNESTHYLQSSFHVEEKVKEEMRRSRPIAKNGNAVGRKSFCVGRPARGRCLKPSNVATNLRKLYVDYGRRSRSYSESFYRHTFPVE
jgi:hypothetical protein